MENLRNILLNPWVVGIGTGIIVGIILFFLNHNANLNKNIDIQNSTLDKSPVVVDSPNASIDNSSTTVKGDYIAGDQINKNGPSLEQIETVFRKVLQENNDSLRREYDDRYAIAGITPDSNDFVVPKGNILSGIEVKWDTGKVVRVSSESIEVLVPDIIMNAANLTMMHNVFKLPKEVGAKSNILTTEDFSVFVKIIGIEHDIVVVVVGVATID